MTSEPDASSCQAVAQFVLVPYEGHEAHVRLDEDGLIQDQDTISFPRNGLHAMGFLSCLSKLFTEVLDLWTEGVGCSMYQKSHYGCV